MDVRGFSAAPTIPGVTEDEPVVDDTEMDSEHVADIERNPVAAAVTVHKVTTESGSGRSSAGTSIGTAGSLMGSDCAEPMDASDIALPNAYEEKRLFFRVYSNETLRPCYTAHNLVESLIGGVSVNLPAPLVSLHGLFDTQRESDYLFYVTELLALDYIQERPEPVVIDLLTSLQFFVIFIQQAYLSRKFNMQYSVEHLISMLKDEESLRRIELIKIMQDATTFPKNGMLLFIIATHFYVLLIQEILSLRDLPDCQESKCFISEVTNLLKSCAEFVLRYFNKHWKARLEGISYVSISKNALAKEKKQEMSKQFELTALIKDRYRLSKDPISLCQTECSEELMETETHKLLMFANSLRDDYIIKRYADLQNNMYFPVESAAVWMKLMVKLANFSATEQKSCLMVLHRQNLKDGKSNGKAAFTLQPQAEPVAFHFENYSNPEVSFEVESSADGLQELICDRNKTSYMCARCLADREDEGKVTLIE
ncbi:hypothetical protein EB796_015777 [Bugula neritina]|uniref:Uncharacterized protein n=1 Tax=Bugula neritina TaxID=10212 RepID=A0A7J7JJY4_BUGNE|nr:hypothetical protein EB796_015777 [Bugula neritina]